MYRASLISSLIAFSLFSYAQIRGHDVMNIFSSDQGAAQSSSGYSSRSTFHK